jgi:hypothetical protein
MIVGLALEYLHEIVGHFAFVVPVLHAGFDVVHHAHDLDVRAAVLEALDEPTPAAMAE